MSKKLKRVAVTGGAGQIAYSLLFRIANGDMLGYDQPIALHILEVPDAINALQGVKMELEDCAFPLLKEIRIGSDPNEVFKDVDFALLVGAKPRGPGMERKDLLNENGKIFIGQGKALNEVASQDVKVLVVGNPCNTNALIAMSHAPRIPRENFHAMTRLDQNRAISQLALKANCDATDVTHMIIWGNHSSTQVPDFLNARIRGKPATEVIKDRKWLEGEFISTIQKRGAAIIAARGKSSAASAANAAIDAVKSIVTATPTGGEYSTAIISNHNPYGIDTGLFFSFPCRTVQTGKPEIIKEFVWDDFLKKLIKNTETELKEERDLVKNCLGKNI